MFFTSSETSHFVDFFFHPVLRFFLDFPIPFHLLHLLLFKFINEISLLWLIVRLAVAVLALNNRVLLPIVASGVEDDVNFFGLGTVGIIDDDRHLESALQGPVSEHVELLGPVRVNLEDCPCSRPHCNIEGLKKILDSGDGVLILLVGDAEPLDSGDGNDAIENSRSEKQPLSNVVQNEALIR